MLDEADRHMHIMSYGLAVVYLVDHLKNEVMVVVRLFAKIKKREKRNNNPYTQSYIHLPTTTPKNTEIAYAIDRIRIRCRYTRSETRQQMATDTMRPIEREIKPGEEKEKKINYR